MNLFLFIREISSLNYAIICDTSKNYFNYRHFTNLQIFYQKLINNGFTNEFIVPLFIEDPLKDKRHLLDKVIHLNDTLTIPYVQLKPRKFNLDTLLNILNCKDEKLYKLDENDNLLIYLTGHGNDDFFMLHNRYFLMLDDIMEVLFYLSKRLNKVLFILDTCQASALIDQNSIPKNVTVIATSSANESSFSTNVSYNLGLNTVDDFAKRFHQIPIKRKLKVVDFFSPKIFGTITSNVMVFGNKTFNMKDFFYQNPNKRILRPFKIK
ncbi:GPI8 [Hepatospora eriocheir]|uniref:GPI8 n=1 Tax=Hepatospora eriocheir TaxID=1081669 RepID=A0A1X0QKV7_9MICR|nr:GPI8 [Hepatospora eriocheir]